MTSEEKSTILFATMLASAIFPPAGAVGVGLLGTYALYRCVAVPTGRAATRTFKGFARMLADAHQVGKEDEERRREEALQLLRLQEQIRRDNARLPLDLQYALTPAASKRLPPEEWQRLLRTYMPNDQPPEALENRQPLIGQAIKTLAAGAEGPGDQFATQIRDSTLQHRRRLQAIQAIPALEPEMRDELVEEETNRFRDVLREFTIDDGNTIDLF